MLYLCNQTSLDFSCVSNMGATAQVDKRATPAGGYKDTDTRSGKRKETALLDIRLNSVMSRGCPSPIHSSSGCSHFLVENTALELVVL